MEYNYQKFINLNNKQNNKKQRFDLFSKMFSSLTKERIKEGKIKKQIEDEIFNLFESKISHKMINKYLMELIDDLGERQNLNKNVKLHNKNMIQNKTRKLIEERKMQILSLIDQKCGAIQIQQKTNISRSVIRKYFSNFKKQLDQYDRIGTHNKKVLKQKKKRDKIKEKTKKVIQQMVEKGQIITLANIIKYSNQTFKRNQLLFAAIEEMNLMDKYYKDYKSIRSKNGKNNGKKGSETVSRYWENVRKEQIELIQKRVDELILEGKHRTLIEETILSQYPNIYTWILSVYLDDKEITKYHKTSYYVNNMFGKQPSKKAGIGCKGWIKRDQQKIFFRSSLQLKVFSYFIYNNIDFNMSKHRIPYILDGIKRTYLPDIQKDGKVYQIKPEKLQNLKINEIKHYAAKDYLKQFNLEIEYIDQRLFIDIDIQQIVKYFYKEGCIQFSTELDKIKYQKYNGRIQL